MKRYAILAAVLVWSTAMLAEPPNMDEFIAAQKKQRDMGKLAEANNTFAFNLFKQISHDQPAKNLMVSPYSTWTVLQMVARGGAGRTEAEMLSVLAGANIDRATMDSANEVFSRLLNEITNNVIINTANAVWYRTNSEVKQEFIVQNAKFSGATFQPIDFTDPHCVDVIDAWASEKTHGKISRLVDGMIDPVNTRLLLASALYFKGDWLEPFKLEDTKEQSFYLRGGGTRLVPMMYSVGKFSYQHAAGYQAVELYYADCGLSMSVILPETNSTPEQFIDLMMDGRWEANFNERFKWNDGSLQLPKFKLDCQVELNQPLEALGIKDAFVWGIADFSGIGSGLFLSRVFQKSTIEVTEKGTEAASIVGAFISDSINPPPPPKPFEMIVDRPFIFLIREAHTGIILFMGIVYDPQSDQASTR